MKQNQLELDLFEASQYHDIRRWGYFSILFKDHDGSVPYVRQESFPLSEMHQVIPLLAKTDSRDYWISQADFLKRNRRAVHMGAIGVVFVDLDYYKQPELGTDPETIAHLVHERCQTLGWPNPSLMIDSGRGLQLKWFHEPIPRAALPRWHHVEDAFVAGFKNLGADQLVRDVSRVLRLVGSVNQKNNHQVRIIDIDWDGDEPKKHSFDDLALVTLPYDRKTASKFIQKRSQIQQLELIEGGKRNTSGLKAFNPKKLAWDRLEDIRQLAQVRYGGQVPEGMRDEFLFWAANFAALNLWGRTGKFWHEVQQLAIELTPDLHQREINGYLGTVWKKMQQMARGEWVEFNGRKYPPLYTPKNQTLIKRLEITPDEQKKLRTIIGKDETAKRHAERTRAARRASGMQPRSVYEENSITRQKPWETLGVSRATWYRMGKPKA